MTHVKVHVEPSDACGSTSQGWPSKNELAQIMEEESLDMITQIGGPDAIVGLARRLGSDPAKGLPSGVPDSDARIEWFGGNYFAQKKLAGYLSLVWDALHDKTMLLLIVMATVSLISEMAFGEHPDTGWIESVAIYVSVAIIVNVQAGTDYAKERMFHKLNQELDASNKKVHCQRE